MPVFNVLNTLRRPLQNIFHPHRHPAQPLVGPGPPTSSHDPRSLTRQTAPAPSANPPRAPKRIKGLKTSAPPPTEPISPLPQAEVERETERVMSDTDRILAELEEALASTIELTQGIAERATSDTDRVLAELEEALASTIELTQGIGERTTATALSLPQQQSQQHTSTAPQAQAQFIEVKHQHHHSIHIHWDSEARSHERAQRRAAEHEEAERRAREDGDWDDEDEEAELFEEMSSWGELPSPRYSHPQSRPIRRWRDEDHARQENDKDAGHGHGHGHGDEHLSVLFDAEEEDRGTLTPTPLQLPSAESSFDIMEYARRHRIDLGRGHVFPGIDEMETDADGDSDGDLSPALAGAREGAQPQPPSSSCDLAPPLPPRSFKRMGDNHLPLRPRAADFYDRSRSPSRSLTQYPRLAQSLLRTKTAPPFKPIYTDQLHASPQTYPHSHSTVRRDSLDSLTVGGVTVVGQPAPVPVAGIWPGAWSPPGLWHHPVDFSGPTSSSPDTDTETEAETDTTINRPRTIYRTDTVIHREPEPEPEPAVSPSPSTHRPTSRKRCLSSLSSFSGDAHAASPSALLCARGCGKAFYQVQSPTGWNGKKRAVICWDCDVRMLRYETEDMPTPKPKPLNVKPAVQRASVRSSTAARRKTKHWARKFW